MDAVQNSLQHRVRCKMRYPYPYLYSGILQGYQVYPYPDYFSISA